MKPPSPLEARAREHSRRAALAKLKGFADRWGVHMAARVLLTTCKPHLLEKIRGDGCLKPQLSSLLELYGVGFSCGLDRRVSVRDSQGEFTFVDDVYGSGVEYVLGGLFKQLGLQHPLPLPDRVPLSLKEEMQLAGFPVDAQGGRDYLATLHPNMPGDLRYRLQGGNFAELRELAQVSPPPQEPTEKREKPIDTITRVLRRLRESELGKETFLELSQQGLAVIKNTPHYGNVCQVTTRSCARSLRIAGRGPDDIINAFLVGKARKKTNLEIFSVLCRKMI
jgi:hypothetical protein